MTPTDKLTAYPSKTEIFWCAERIGEHGLCGEWWTGISGYAEGEQFTKDIEQAARFKTENEASEVIAFEQLQCIATEHILYL